MSRDDENFGKDSDESIAPLLQPSNPIITEPHPSGHVIPTQSSSPKPVSPADSSSLTRSPLRMISRFSGSEASESRLPSEGARQVFQDTSSALDTGTPPFPQRLTVPAHNPPSNDPDGSCSFVHVGSLSNIETSCPQSPNTSSAQRASPSSAQRASPSSAQRASPSSAQRASPSSATAGVEVNFSARLVSASGPVVGAPTGWRRATDAALSRRSRSALVSNTVRNEDANGGVGRGVRDGQVSRGAQDSSGRQLLGIRGRAARGTSQPGVLAGSRRLLRPDERFSRGSELIPPDDDHWVNGESSLARHRDEAEGLESAPWGQGEDRTPLGAIGGGDSLEPGAIDPQTPGPTPAEIRRALEQSQNTLPLLVLLVVHFVFTHLMDITAFALGTAVLAGLDRRLRAHADVRDMKNVVSLVVVAAAAISTVLLSALILRGQPWGGELLRGLILAAPRPPLHSLSDVIRAVAVVDLWARLISVAVKVFAALLASRQRNFSSSTGCLNTGAIARSCANSRCCSGVIPRQTSCRLCTWRLRSGGDRSRGRASPFPSSRPGEHAAEHELHGLVNSLRGAGRTALGERSAGAGVTWRDRFCTGGIVSAVMCCVGVILPCSVRRRRGWSSRFQGDNGWWDSGGEGRSGEGILGEDSQGEGAGGEAHGQRTVEEADREISTAELLGSSGRQRRIRALLEMAFLLYRTLLPVPAWLEYYGKDGDNFAAGYLVLKCMVVSLRVERLARAVCYVRRGDLERGKFATPEEVAEAGSPDCSICYERITRPLLLPCEHLFCGECVAEWLERERTCPLCRSEVPTSNPIPKALQDGRTALRPQLL